MLKSDRTRIIIIDDSGVKVADSGWMDTEKIGGAEVKDWSEDTLVTRRYESSLDNGVGCLIGWLAVIVCIIVGSGLIAAWLYGY